MRSKAYRDSFVEAHLSTNIAAQIQTLREERGWTQAELGKRAGMAQNRISVLEDPAYDQFTFSTLRRIASAYDVALIARFVPFSELVGWVADLSPEKLHVPDFEHDVVPAMQPIGISLMDMPSAAVTAAASITAGMTYGTAFGSGVSGTSTNVAHGFSVQGQPISAQSIHRPAEPAGYGTIGVSHGVFIVQPTAEPILKRA